MAVTVVGAALVNLGINSAAWFKGLDAASKRWTRFGAGLQVAGFRMMTTITAAVAAVGGAIIKFGKDWELAFAHVRKTMEVTGPQASKVFGLIEKGIRSMAQMMPFAATELANIARIGAQLGVAPENILKFTDTIAKLSVAVKELDPEEAARKLTRLINITGGDMNDIDRLASVLAKLGDNFATTEESILNFSERAAGLARISDITAQDLMGIATAFTSVRAQTESGATAMSKALGVIAEAVGSNAGKLEALAATAGMTAEQFKKSWDTDAAATFVEIIDGVAGAGIRGVEVLKAIGLNNERAKQTFLALAGATGEAKRGLEMARAEWEKNEKLTREYEAIAKTLDAQLTVLFNNVKEEGIKIFQAFRDQFTAIIEAAFVGIKIIGSLVDSFLAMDKATQATVIQFVGLSAILGPILLVVGALLSVLVAFGSVLIPVGLALGALFLVLKDTWGQSLSLSDALMIVVEVFAELADIGNKAERVILSVTRAIQELAMGMLKGFKVTAMLSPLAAIPGLLGKVDTAMADLAGRAAETQQKIVDSYLKTDDIGKKLEPWKKKVFDMVTDLKTSVRKEGEEGLFSKLVGGQEKLDEIQKAIKDSMGESEKAVKGLGETTTDVTDIISEDANKTKTALESLVESIDKMSEKILNFKGSITGTPLSSFSEGALGILEGLLKLSPAMIQEAGDDLTAAIGEALLRAGEQIPGSPMMQSMKEQIAKAMFDMSSAGLDTGKLNEQFLGLGGFGATSIENLIDKATGFGAPGVPQNPFIDPSVTEDTARKFKMNWGRAIRDTQKIFKAFGFDVNTTMGALIQGAAQFATMIGSKEGWAAFKAGGTIGQGDIGGTIAGGLQGVGAVLGATGSGSRGKRVAGGAMSGAAAGAQMGGPIGAAVGAIGGAIVGLFRGRKVLGAMKKAAEYFGAEISEELGEAIVESSKNLGSLENAMAANLGSILEETGVDSSNIEKSMGMFTHLVGMVENGTMSMSEATEELNKSFELMVEHLETMGNEGSLAIGKLVQTQLRAGVVTDEVKNYIKEQASTLRDELAPAISYIAGLENMSAEQALAYQGVLIAGWGAAVVETESLIQAVGLMGEEFRTALANIMEILGPEGQALVGPIAEIINVVENSGGALEAMAGIVNGLDSMAKMGILTKDSLAAMGEAIRQTFDDAVEKTGNFEGALRASWPELVKTYKWFESMGMEVPGWLQDAIDKGSELGYSMEIPTTVLDALTEMVGLLQAIAEEMGAVASETRDAARAARSIPENVGSGRRGGGNPDGMAEGGWIPAAPPHGTLFIGGEKEPELVIPQSKLDSVLGGGGGESVAINVQVDAGNFLGTPEEFSEKLRSDIVGWMRNNKGGFQSAITEVITRNG